jgi:putative transposase
MIIAHKIALDLNNRQASYCQKAVGTVRFSYNWALAEWNAQYQAWKLDNAQPKPSQAALRRQLNAVKLDDGSDQKRPANGNYPTGLSLQKLLCRTGKVPAIQKERQKPRQFYPQQ